MKAAVCFDLHFDVGGQLRLRVTATDSDPMGIIAVARTMTSDTVGM